jgi:transcriptional regulator with XRE-family HTH domain
MSFKLNLYTPREIEVQIAARLKCLRLKHNLTRVTLSKNSGVSFGSIKRFETTGKISFTNLLKLASALGSLDDFSSVFEDNNIITLANLERVEKGKKRKRGRL